jgi:methylmalonyl-CoA mutase N-terminal domain/subunit
LLALRTQQVLGYETGVPETVDPLAGSYFVESLTDRIEADAMDLIARIDELGGATAAIGEGFQQREIEEAAYTQARAVDRGDATVVGVNRFVTEREPEPEMLRIGPELEVNQRASLNDVREQRDPGAVDTALEALSMAASGDDNIVYPMKTALEAGATIGDITATLVPIFGRYRPTF